MKRSFPLVPLLYALIVIAGILRVTECIIDNPLDNLFSDPKRHWLNGLRLFHPDLMGASDPILYQLYIYTLQKVTGQNHLLIGIFTGLLSALMPWTFYRAVRELQWSKESSLICWLVISWMPSLWSIYSYFMMETLLLPLLGLSLWMAARFLRKQSLSCFLIMVAAWTLATLTKPSVVPLAGFIICFSLWKSRSPWQWLLYGVVLGMILVLPGSVRAYRTLGFFAPWGQPWIVKIQYRMPQKHIVIDGKRFHYIFSSPSDYVRPFEPLSDWMIRPALNEDRYVFNVDASNGDRDWKHAYQAIPFGWKDWMSRQGENLALLLFAPSWPDSNVHDFNGWMNYVLRWIWAPLILFVILGNFDRWKLSRVELVPLATIALLCFLVFQPFALMEGRYRKPLEPLLILNLVWLVAPTTVPPNPLRITIPGAKSKE